MLIKTVKDEILNLNMFEGVRINAYKELEVFKRYFYENAPIDRDNPRIVAPIYELIHPIKTFSTQEAAENALESLLNALMNNDTVWDVSKH